MSDKHFEDLWVESEKLFEQEIKEISIAAILQDLKNKILIYETLDKQLIEAKDKHKLKTNVFGKILSCLTQLSLKDDINTFIALQQTVNENKIDQLNDFLK